MPKIMSLDDTLNFLEEMQEKDPNYSHQFTVRFPVRDAIKLVKEALSNNEQQTERLRDIVHGYYSGESIKLNPTVALLLERIADILGKSPPEALTTLLIEFGMNKLKSLVREKQMA